jgi:hypothetical protein
MTNPERAELDILRAEKSRWEALRDEDRAERARMMQEVNELRSQVFPAPTSSELILERGNGRKSYERSITIESQRNTTSSFKK